MTHLASSSVRSSVTDLVRSSVSSLVTHWARSLVTHWARSSVRSSVTHWVRSCSVAVYALDEESSNMATCGPHIMGKPFEKTLTTLDAKYEFI